MCGPDNFPEFDAQSLASGQSTLIPKGYERRRLRALAFLIWPWPQDFLILDQGPGIVPSDNFDKEWKRIATAPFDRDLELAVTDYDGPHALVFPCRRVLNGWINAETKERLATNALARVAGAALGTVSLSLRWII